MQKNIASNSFILVFIFKKFPTSEGGCAHDAPLVNNISCTLSCTPSFYTPQFPGSAPETYPPLHTDILRVQHKANFCEECISRLNKSKNQYFSAFRCYILLRYWVHFEGKYLIEKITGKLISFDPLCKLYCGSLWLILVYDFVLFCVLLFLFFSPFFFLIHFFFRLAFWSAQK